METVNVWAFIIVVFTAMGLVEFARRLRDQRDAAREERDQWRRIANQAPDTGHPRGEKATVLDAPADPPASGDFPAVARPLPAGHPARSAGRVGDSPPAARPHFTPPTPRE